MIEPITAVPIGKNRYQIVTGHRRFRAAKMAKLEEINVIVCDPEEAEEIRRRKSLISNLQRENINPVELAEGLVFLKGQDPKIKTNRDLARVLGKTEHWVSDTLRINTMQENVKQILRTSEAPISKRSVETLARVDDTQEQEKIAESMIQGASSREVIQRARQVKQRKPQPPTRKRPTPASPPPQPKPSMNEHSRKGKGWYLNCGISVNANPKEIVAALQEMARYFLKGL